MKLIALTVLVLTASGCQPTRLPQYRYGERVKLVSPFYDDCKVVIERYTGLVYGARVDCHPYVHEIYINGVEIVPPLIAAPDKEAP